MNYIFIADDVHAWITSFKYLGTGLYLIQKYPVSGRNRRIIRARFFQLSGIRPDSKNHFQGHP